MNLGSIISELSDQSSAKDQIASAVSLLETTGEDREIAWLQAIELLKPHAARGVMQAQIYLANAYVYLNDIENSNKWYKEIAHIMLASDFDQSSRGEAENALAEIFLHGHVAKQDFQLALHLYRQVTEKNNVDAQADKEAKSYLKLYQEEEIALSGAPDLQAYHRPWRTTDESEVTEQKAEAEQKFAEGIRLSESDPQKAIRIFRDLTKSNDPVVQVNLAALVQTAITKASENSFVAQYLTGVFFAEGIGIAKDLQLAVIWLGTAATNGIKQAGEFLNQLVQPVSSAMPPPSRADEKYTQQQNQSAAVSTKQIIQGPQTEGTAIPVRRTEEKGANTSPASVSLEIKRSSVEVQLPSQPTITTGNSPHPLSLGAENNQADATQDTQEIIKQAMSLMLNEPEAALALLLQAATLEEPTAYLHLGDYFWNNAEPDRKSAMYWYLKAAAKGLVADVVKDAAAMVEQAKKLRFTRSEEAFVILQQAASLEYPEAYYRMGNCFEYGIGTPQDPQVAFIHYQDAADRGFFYGMKKVAECFQQGIGVIQDEEKAIEFFEKAATEGNAVQRAEANNDLAVLLLVRFEKGLIKKEETTKIFELFKSSADAGFHRAQFNLYGILMKGELVPKNENQALEYLRKAAAQNEENAVLELSRREHESKALQSDFSRLKKRVNENPRDHEALYLLGLCYAQGNGVLRNEQLAIECYLQAQENGSVQATLALETLLSPMETPSFDEKQAPKTNVGSFHPLDSVRGQATHPIGPTSMSLSSSSTTQAALETAAVATSSVRRLSISTQAIIQAGTAAYSGTTSAGSTNSSESLAVVQTLPQNTELTPTQPETPRNDM